MGGGHPPEAVVATVRERRVAVLWLQSLALVELVLLLFVGRFLADDLLGDVDALEELLVLELGAVFLEVAMVLGQGGGFEEGTRNIRSIVTASSPR